ncbi:MAG: hypothetical protein K5867_10655 [Bacteroidales bacterium]|nr:hypothetical protein [Bacteroidales bacterium]
MTNHQLQQLRDLPIEEVASRLGLEVTRHKALCPFHDDHHASLSFHTRRNTFRCFVCDARGGTIDLVMQYLHKDFKEACQWLSNGTIEPQRPHSTPLSNQRGAGGESSFDATRYARFFAHPYLSQAARRFLFDERRLDPRVVRWCRLTSWRDRNGIDWLQIPYYDQEGHLIGIQNRNLSLPLQGEVGGGQPRFRFPRGSQCGIYNLPVLNRLKPGEALYITEGASDCWAMLSAGHKAIAIPSATLLKPQDVKQLETLNLKLGTQFHMYPDQDEPGERLFLQLKKILPDLQHHHLPPNCKDYSDYYLQLKTTPPHRVLRILRILQTKN